MADKKEKAVVEKAAAEATYTMEEFVEARDKVFGEGTLPQLVMAAFRFNKVEKATVAEAKKLYKEFAERKVEK